MSRINFRLSLIAMIVIGCGVKGSAQPAPTAGNPPIQLTVTNLPPKTNALAAKTEKALEVKDAGVLHISFPATWEDKLTRLPGRGRMIDAIMFRPRGGGDFELMVDFNNVGEAGAARVDIRAALQTMGQAVLTNSVEKALEIHDVQGSQTTACYFVVTDRNYHPDHHAKGDYNYLTQGYARMGPLILSFHMVSNHLPPEQEQLLEMIKTARLEKKP